MSALHRVGASLGVGLLALLGTSVAGIAQQGGVVLDFNVGEADGTLSWANVKGNTRTCWDDPTPADLPGAGRGRQQNCIETGGGCSISVLDASGSVREADEFLDRWRELAKFQYVRNQENLHWEFRVDVSDCNVDAFFPRQPKVGSEN